MDRFKTVAQVREEQLGMSETPDYFSLKATVTSILAVELVAFDNEAWDVKFSDLP
jgi:hypothetical protein